MPASLSSLSLLVLMASLGAPGAPDATARPIRPGESLRGVVASGDPAVTAQRFLLAAEADGTLTLLAASLDFDTVLSVARLSPAGSEVNLGEDDDEGVGTNSRFVLVARRGERFRLEVRAQQDFDGSGDFEVAVQPGDVASAYRADPGERDRAEQEYWTSAQQRARRAGHRPHLARALLGHAELLRARSDYDGARSLIEEAAALAQAYGGPDHPDVATTVNNLAAVLFDAGAYAEARVQSEKAVRIWEKRTGPESLDVAYGIHNLALTLLYLGLVAEGMEQIERALSIRELQFGPDHLEVADALDSLAGSRSRAGRPAEALALHTRALSIRERRLGPEHPDVARSLYYLGDLHTRNGDYATARTLLERSLAVRTRTLGPDHPDTSVSLIGLAALHTAMGAHVEAIPPLERALAACEKTLGPEHLWVADALAWLAHAHFKAGSCERALPVAERSLAIREKQLGPWHPLVGSSLNMVAICLSESGKVQDAFATAAKSEEVTRQNLRLNIRALPEPQALRLASTRHSGLDVMLSQLGRDRGVAVPVAPAWDVFIRSRAAVLDEMAARQRNIAESGDAPIRQLTQALSAATSRYVNLAYAEPRDADYPGYRQQVDTARAEKERIETDLARRSAGFGALLEQKRIGWEEIRRSLPPGSALVGYVRHRNWRSGEPRNSRRAYLAFVGRGSGEPVAVPLGDAGTIDALAARWRAEAGARLDPDSRLARRREAAARAAGLSLRRSVWDPVAPHVGDARRVFVVADGALSLVNLAALPGDGASWLIETGPLISYLTAERDLLPRTVPSRTGAGLLALGGPSFDLAPGSPPPTPSSGLGSRGGASVCAEFSTLRFEPLPHAAREVAEVAALWRRGDPTKARMLTGAAATEAAFKREAPGRRTIHLATHGFFLGDRCPSVVESGRGTAGEGAAPAPSTQAGENPLLLSGLALAGANHRSVAGTGQEDGILTAQEVASMDLSGLDLVVLSACDTGLGEVRAGEGVFGLRRAFQVAGAHSLVMSLWAVDDESTRKWMRLFYEALLLRGLPAAAAAQEASVTMLAARRSAGAATHPYPWAGFVALGPELNPIPANPGP